MAIERQQCSAVVGLNGSWATTKLNSGCVTTVHADAPIIATIPIAGGVIERAVVCMGINAALVTIARKVSLRRGERAGVGVDSALSLHQPIWHATILVLCGAEVIR